MVIHTTQSLVRAVAEKLRGPVASRASIAVALRAGDGLFFYVDILPAELCAAFYVAGFEL